MTRTASPIAFWVGRADLASNPFTQSVIASLRDVAGSDGEGMLIDNNGRMIYHPNPYRLMESLYRAGG